MRHAERQQASWRKSTGCLSVEGFASPLVVLHMKEEEGEEEADAGARRIKVLENDAFILKSSINECCR